MLFNDKGTDYWRFFENLKHTDVRVLPHISTASIMIIDGEVFIFSYENDIQTIHIPQISIATSFSLFFDDLWNIGKE